MTGPSLRKRQPHHSIHKGIYTEARNLTKLLKKLYAEERETPLREIADALVEHWETRTFAHAASEEEGLFAEKLKSRPELKELICKLKRDHQLLHLIVHQVKEKIAAEGITEETITYFETLLVLFRIHNQEEEDQLFDKLDIK